MGMFGINTKQSESRNYYINTKTEKFNRTSHHKNDEEEESKRR